MKTGLLLFIFISLVSASYAANREFWDQQKKGADFFNKVPTEQWFIDAKNLGVEWVRLAYDKWEPEYRDFLIGDVSDYKGLVREDLDKLKQVISWANKYGIKLVITPLSLPGNRYIQNNDYQHDMRLWKSYDYWNQAIRFWKDLANELKDFDNVVAYNIINEPSPEFETGVAEHKAPGDVSDLLEWYETVKDTPRDLYTFYGKMIREIRQVDPDTPIMLDAGWYGQPGAFCYWPGRFSDPNILYSFHMYEPYEFTSNRNYRERHNYFYPGKVPFGKDIVYWDKNTIDQYFEPFLQWIGKNTIPANRVVAGEFGCMRRNKGAEQYLRDILTFLNTHQFHWAFYSFREDEWDGYDYELGAKGLGRKYWQEKENGGNPPLPRKDNDLFMVIKQQF